MFTYFIHPTNLSTMDAVLKMRMSEGSAGYGVYIQLLELMRDAEDYTISYDPVVIAWSIHEPDQERVTRVCTAYGLFDQVEGGRIRSPWLCTVMQEHEQRRVKLAEAGKRSAAARARKASKPSTTLEQPLNQVATTLNTPPQPGCNLVDPNEQQTNKKKPNNTKKENPITPSGVKEGGDLFSDDLIKEVGRDKSPLFDPSEDGRYFPSGDGHNTNPLTAAAITWHLTVRQVGVLYEATRKCEIGSAPFMALLAAFKHCQETGFRPKYPFEYFMSRIKDSRDL